MTYDDAMAAARERLAARDFDAAYLFESRQPAKVSPRT
jgi:hypothetical protein